MNSFRSLKLFKLVESKTLFYPVFENVQLLVNIGGYLGLFIGLSLNDLFGYRLDFIVATVSRRRKI